MRHVRFLPLVLAGQPSRLPRDRSRGRRRGRGRGRRGRGGQAREGEEPGDQDRPDPRGRRLHGAHAPIARAIACCCCIPPRRSQPAAANALLKTLEEPPARTLIVLVSDRPSRLLATIRSRCRLLALPRRRAPEALAWLAREGVDEPEAALAAGRRRAAARARARRSPRKPQLRRTAAGRARAARRAPIALAFAGPIERGVRRAHRLLAADLGARPGPRAPRGRRRATTSISPPALQARARRRDLEALFALDRELARRAPPRLAPAQSAPAGRAPADGLQSSHSRADAMSESRRPDRCPRGPGCSPW